jgi:hypothetical protein
MLRWTRSYATSFSSAPGRFDVELRPGDVCLVISVTASGLGRVLSPRGGIFRCDLRYELDMEHPGLVRVTP